MTDRDGNISTDPEQTPYPPPEPIENPRPTGWLDALNSCLERANKADLDTGC